MTYPHRTDESLAALILGRTEPDVPAGGHLDENTLALLELGAASPAELHPIVEHLARCAPCRKRVAEVVGPAVLPRASRSRRPGWYWLAGGAVAVAAGVLVAATLSLTRRDSDFDRRVARAQVALAKGEPSRALDLLRPMLAPASSSAAPRVREESEALAQQALVQLMVAALAGRQFDRVEALAAEADRLGIREPRLASLRAQAVRRMSGPLALAFAGRLDHFGVILQAPGSKALPEEDPNARRALAILKDPRWSGPPDRDAALNLAHALLSSDPRAAAGRFAGWLGVHPDDPDARLGLGLAEYLTGDHAAAAATLEALLDRHPDRLDARVDLALALEAAGQKGRAVTEWRRVLQDTTDATLRAQVETRLRLLDELRGAAWAGTANSHDHQQQPATRAFRRIFLGG